MLANSNGAVGGGVLVIIILGAAAYFFPSIIAGARGVPNFGSVVVVNIFLGWTLIGWVVAMAMAARSTPPVHATTVNVAPSPPPYRPPAPPRLEPTWHPDPSGRFKARWHNGERWTEHVVTHQDEQTIDRGQG